MPTEIAITGAAGRMGTRLVALGSADKELKVVAAVGRAGHKSIGKDAGDVAGVGPIGTPLSSELRGTPKVLIDFSTPEAMREWIAVCRDKKIALLIGTTGLEKSDHALIDQAAREIAILQAPNMSLGVAVLFQVAAQVGKQLGLDYDIEVVEAHHRFKKDKPSGTAVGLTDAIKASTGRTDIPTHSLRIGDEVGKHTAYFASLGERLELTHVATNRDTFVRGALRAAKWLALQKPGRYAIADVLGLR